MMVGYTKATATEPQVTVAEKNHIVGQYDGLNAIKS